MRLPSLIKRVVRSVAFVAVVLILALGAAWHWSYWPFRPQASVAGAASGKAAAPAPVPVTVATVKQADFPVYLDGLGTVMPFNTVAIKTQVDGQIVKMAVKEGQRVHQGDVLVEIDPKPFQAALAQATAKKAQDEANSQNALRHTAGEAVHNNSAAT